MLIDRCLICDNVCDSHFLCPSCLATLQSETFNTFMSRCPVCYYPIVGKEYSCPRCLKATAKGKENFPVYCVSTYDGNLSYSVLQRFKFKNDKKLSNVVVYMLNQGLEVLDPRKSAIIVPIPCSKTSFRKRGWDQMKEVSKYLGREVLDLLEVSSNATGQQKLLDRSQRLSKTSKRYEFSKKYNLKETLSHIAGRQIILIDDVSTTFSTLTAAREALKKIGLEEVKAVVWLYDLKAERLDSNRN